MGHEALEGSIARAVLEEITLHARIAFFTRITVHPKSSGQTKSPGKPKFSEAYDGGRGKD